MYTPESIRTGIKYPSKIVSELNRVYAQYRYGVRYYPHGDDVFEEDWDNLLILDACRYDEYRRHVDGDGQRVGGGGRLERRTSRGSTTHQFIRGNFGGRNLYDLVYVGANGWYTTLQDEIDSAIYDFIHVERDAVDELTSRPETVTDTAIEAADRYPNKRLVVHYMQPHQPYLGPTGRRLEHDGALYRTVRKNHLDRADVVRAYRENLVLVLDEVERLVDELDGKTVVTADHGELLGERQRPLPVRYYGHPDGVYVSELLTVPWHVYESETRKEVVAEVPVESNRDADDDGVEDHLRALGYRL